MDHTALSKLETGGRIRINPDLLDKIATALGTDVASLLGTPPPSVAAPPAPDVLAAEIAELPPGKRALLLAFLKFLRESQLSVSIIGKFFGIDLLT